MSRFMNILFSLSAVSLLANAGTGTCPNLEGYFVCESNNLDFPNLESHLAEDSKDGKRYVLMYIRLPSQLRIDLFTPDQEDPVNEDHYSRDYCELGQLVREKKSTTKKSQNSVFITYDKLSFERTSEDQVTIRKNVFTSPQQPQSPTEDTRVICFRR